jgi:hypothetical protein
MSNIKKIAACLAVTALLGAVAASPASAQRFPEGPGQPVLTGELESHGVLHCQAFIEMFIGEELPPGTFPGNIVVLPNGTLKDVSPAVHHCPILEGPPA